MRIELDPELLKALILMGGLFMVCLTISLIVLFT